jgi:hypothetical protein
MARKFTHGGRRKGAGRKPLDQSGRGRAATIWLTPADEDQLRGLAPTLSEAVRRLLKERGNHDHHELKQKGMGK